MKSKSFGKLDLFNKIMLIIVPIMVLLFIVAVVMCVAFSVLPMPANKVVGTGNLTIIFSASSAGLAIIGILFALFSKSGDKDE